MSWASAAFGSVVVLCASVIILEVIKERARRRSKILPAFSRLVVAGNAVRHVLNSEPLTLNKPEAAELLDAVSEAEDVLRSGVGYRGMVCGVGYKEGGAT